LLLLVPRFTQVPLQFVCPDGHTQAPFTQVIPPVQTRPQLPQLLALVARLTHVETPLMVQVLGALGGHSQVPFAQYLPPAQACPQLPQLLLLVLRLTHVPAQQSGAAAGQAFPHEPQLLLVSRLEHVHWPSTMQHPWPAWQALHEPHLLVVSRLTHVHSPSTMQHPCPVGQAFPHEPQLLVLLARLTQVPPQHPYPGGQHVLPQRWQFGSHCHPQTPLTQVWLEFGGPGGQHALPQHASPAAQHDSLVVVVTEPQMLSHVLTQSSQGPQTMVHACGDTEAAEIAPGLAICIA
jgi:hypothetical protein